MGSEGRTKMSTQPFETWNRKETRKGVRGRISSLEDMKGFLQSAKDTGVDSSTLIVSEGESVYSAEEIKETTNP